MGRCSDRQHDSRWNALRWFREVCCWFVMLCLCFLLLENCLECKRIHLRDKILPFCVTFIVSITQSNPDCSFLSLPILPFTLTQSHQHVPHLLFLRGPVTCLCAWPAGPHLVWSVQPGFLLVCPTLRGIRVVAHRLHQVCISPLLGLFNTLCFI